MDLLDDPNKIEKLLIAKAITNKIPLSASFELTPYCNFNCNMCFIRMNKTEISTQGGIKDLDFWIKTAIELKKCGTLFILLTGGEPLLYPNFNKLYTILRELGFIITINTNGTYINTDVIQLFNQQKPRRVNVTLYGASNETYQKLCHNKTGFNKTIEGIRKLVENNIDTKLSISIVKENLHEFEKMLKIGETFNIPSVVNSYMFPCTRNIYQTKDFKSRLDPIIGGKIGAISMKHRKGEHPKSFFAKELTKLTQNKSEIKNLYLSCRAGTSQVWITWQGKMVPCVMMEYPSINLSQHNVIDAWEELKKGCQLLPTIEECKGCKLKTICQVCYASAILEKQHFGNLNYLCNYTNSEFKTIKSFLDDKE